MPRILEIIARIGEWIFGPGQTDMMPHGLLLNMILFNQYVKQQGKVKTFLFNIEKDPYETTNLVDSEPKILRRMVLSLQDIKHKRPVPIHKYWLVDERAETSGLKPGDCSQQSVGLLDKCLFTHPWLEDGVDLYDTEALGLVNGLTRAQRTWLTYCGLTVLIVIIMLMVIFKTFKLLCFNKTQRKVKRQ